jgi:hypothetical protein
MTPTAWGTFFIIFFALFVATVVTHTYFFIVVIDGLDR